VSVIGELASFGAPAPLGGQGEVASLLIDPSYD